MPNYKKKIRKAARRNRVRPELLVAQIGQESSFNPDAVSPAGARGIAQFMTATAEGYGVDLYDGNPNDDIEGAARHMRDLLDRFNGNERLALAAYNAGAGAVEKYGGVPPYAETRAYVKKILGAAGRSKGSGRTLTNGRRNSRIPVYETTPGVDNSALRQQLKLSYLEDRGNPQALLDLALGLQGAQDIPASRERVGTRTVRRARSAGKGDGIGGPLLELFYNGPGGVNVDNGKRVGKGFVSGHTDHVHVAAGPKSVVKLGRLAQRMGLTVRENPAFDKVDPVHTEGSYHYRNQAIDVSGDPDLMRKFSRRVARLYRV